MTTATRLDVLTSRDKLLQFFSQYIIFPSLEPVHYWELHTGWNANDYRAACQKKKKKKKIGNAVTAVYRSAIITNKRVKFKRGAAR